MNLLPHGLQETNLVRLSLSLIVSSSSKLKGKAVDDVSNNRLHDVQLGGTHVGMVSSTTQTEKIMYEDVKSVADHLLKETKICPEVGIIYGSGLGELAEDLNAHMDGDMFPYKDIPKFPVTTGM